jgi:hypothetical protein
VPLTADEFRLQRRESRKRFFRDVRQKARVFSGAWDPAVLAALKLLDDPPDSMSIHLLDPWRWQPWVAFERAGAIFLDRHNRWYEDAANGHPIALAALIRHEQAHLCGGGEYEAYSEELKVLLAHPTPMPCSWRTSSASGISMRLRRGSTPTVLGDLLARAVKLATSTLDVAGSERAGGVVALGVGCRPEQAQGEPA